MDIFQVLIKDIKLKEAHTMSNDDSDGVGVMSDSDLSSSVGQDELNHEEDLFSDVIY